MTKKKLLTLALLGAALLAAGCSNSGDAVNGPTNGGVDPTGASTISKLMAQLFNGPVVGTPNNGELSLPVDINGIDLDTASEDPTQFDGFLI